MAGQSSSAILRADRAPTDSGQTTKSQRQGVPSRHSLAGASPQIAGRAAAGANNDAAARWRDTHEAADLAATLRDRPRSGRLPRIGGTQRARSAPRLAARRPRTRLPVCRHGWRSHDSLRVCRKGVRLVALLVFFLVIAGRLAAVAARRNHRFLACRCDHLANGVAVIRTVAAHRLDLLAGKHLAQQLLRHSNVKAVRRPALTLDLLSADRKCIVNTP